MKLGPINDPNSGLNQACAEALTNPDRVRARPLFDPLPPPNQPFDPSNPPKVVIRSSRGAR